MASSTINCFDSRSARPAKALVVAGAGTGSVDGFWIVLIIAMSTTVVITRLYLEATGYPQVGDDTFHVAHVLWGGLAMFIALVLPLSFANPYIPWITAILGGVGAGLFLDEVGKFITQKNDYFFPLAFPIIYAFIVLCVWLFFRIRETSPATRGRCSITRSKISSRCSTMISTRSRCEH